MTKPHRPDAITRGRVKKYVAIGASENEIAILLDIRPGQLRQHYARELEVGAAENNMKVGTTILREAVSGNEKMAIFWAKARMGWRDDDSKKPQGDSPLLNIHIHV